MQKFNKTVFIRFLEKYLFLNNIYLKTVKIILAFVFGLFIALCFIYCVYDGFFVFMFPFAISISVSLNKYLQSNNWLFGFAKYFILNLITTIFILLIAFIFGYYFNLNDFIYCEGEDLNGSNTAESDNKIKLDSADYYHIKKEYVNMGIDTTNGFISKGLELGIEKLAPNIGAGTAAPTIAATVLKSSLPPLQKLALAGTSAAIVGASTKIGLHIGETIIKKKN